MKNARNTRKAAVIISDGGDNYSRLSRAQVRADVLESDMQLYAIGIFDTGAAKRQAPEELNGPDLLDELGHETGGRQYRVDNLDDLAAVAARISVDTRNEYLIGFTPPSSGQRDGKYHRIKVTVDSGGAKLTTHYRRGYYAPGQ